MLFRVMSESSQAEVDFYRLVLWLAMMLLVLPSTSCRDRDNSNEKLELILKSATDESFNPDGAGKIFAFRLPARLDGQTFSACLILRRDSGEQWVLGNLHGLAASGIGGR